MSYNIIEENLFLGEGVEFIDEAAIDEATINKVAINKVAIDKATVDEAAIDEAVIGDNHSISIMDNSTILKSNNIIVYPNEKIYIVAPIIEEKIEERDNYQPSQCLLRCQNCIRMMLDIATRVYIILEYCILWISTCIVALDIFNITKSKLKIVSRSKYNNYTIETAQSERLRRIVYWFYYNYKTADEEDWAITLTKFKLSAVPTFTMRLFIDNNKSKYSIEVSNIELTRQEGNAVIKGKRIIKLYEDVKEEFVNDTFIYIGKRLISTVEGMIPIGGLMAEKFITDLKIDKIDKKLN